MAGNKQRSAKNRCILCSSDMEKSNMGSVCNPCKDKMYKYPFMDEKLASKNVKAEMKAK